MKRTTSGVTLVELLVAMAIFAVLFLMISSVTSSMNRSSQTISTQSRLMQEGQTAQRLLAGRISEAIYVYPANTIITLGAGATIANSIRNTTTWTVNSDPFIAMILPPEAPTYSGSSNIPNNCVAGTSGTTEQTAGCYRFFAYYAVLRGRLTGAGLERSTVPPADALNDRAWVLMQYQANLFDWTPGYSATSAGITSAKIAALTPAMYQGRVGNMLADFIQPQAEGGSNDLFPTDSTPGATANICQLFCVNNPPTSATATTTRSNNGVVDVRFRMEQNVRGRDRPIVVNGAARTAPDNSYIGGVVSPRNWWAAP